MRGGDGAGRAGFGRERVGVSGEEHERVREEKGGEKGRRKKERARREESPRDGGADDAGSQGETMTDVFSLCFLSLGRSVMEKIADKSWVSKITFTVP